jgi:hypothetical protein
MSTVAMRGLRENIYLEESGLEGDVDEEVASFASDETPFVSFASDDIEANGEGEVSANVASAISRRVQKARRGSVLEGAEGAARERARGRTNDAREREHR